MKAIVGDEYLTKHSRADGIRGERDRGRGQSQGPTPSPRPWTDRSIGGEVYVIIKTME